MKIIATQMALLSIGEMNGSAEMQLRSIAVIDDAVDRFPLGLHNYYATTSPTLTVETLDKAIAYAIENDLVLLFLRLTPRTSHGG